MKIKKSYAIYICLGVLAIILLLLLIFVINYERPLNITKMSPASNENLVSLNKKIEVDFSRPLNKKEQSKILVSITPNIKFNETWSNDNKTLIITPEYPYSAETAYNVFLKWWKNGSQLLVFTTSVQPQSELIDQGKSDQYFSNQEKELLGEAPWYIRLPHRTNDYFLAFDPQKNEFYASIYIVDKSEEEIMQDISKFLNSIGVPKNKYPIQITKYNSKPTIITPLP